MIYINTKMKYLDINIPKYAHDIYKENCTTPMNVKSKN